MTAPNAPKSQRWVICPECRREVRVRYDGTIYRHVIPMLEGNLKCAAGGQSVTKYPFLFEYNG